MGRRGPVKMPDNVRALRGTHSERADEKAGVKRVRLTPGAPNPPESLKGEALREWKRVVPDLDRRGLLAKVDRGVLVNYCRAWALCVEALVELERTGLLVSDRDGETRKSPAWQVWREATMVCTTLAKELLITPNARLRATMPEADDGKAAAADILD